MKKYMMLLCLAPLVCLLSACKRENHFIGDSIYRQQVHEQFLKRKELAKHRNEALFSIFDKSDLRLEQREALEFLYAYMPLSDLADADGDFYLKQVDMAFMARDYFTWGKTIPEDVFRHFVLVYRVNNESLDSARTVFFHELKDRVKGLSMKDAALEVNHWCHEKVTYRGTDMRTSAPLALMRTSWGRCGEESVFFVNALRSVGIPARQCYTPRWAHTESNHAWVEVWVDGQWHFMGACEPEPELDMAWFTAAAKRAMMVHTTVFGLYNGPEEKNAETDLYTKINLLKIYADTREVKVKVIDDAGKPVPDATVKFTLYNWAELYPIVERQTNKEGVASVISGIGDLMVWVNKGERYGYAKSSPDISETIVILNKQAGTIYDETFVLQPPVEQKLKEVNADKMAQNARRLLYEDSLRNAYMNTFAIKEYAYQLAQTWHLDKENVWKYLALAQGNWREIEMFITANKANPFLFPFLASLTEKDLRDTPAAYLNDHLNTPVEISKDIPQHLIAPYIYSPRIAYELITPWRRYFTQTIRPEEAANAQLILDYIKQNIKIADEENYYHCYLTPRGAYELKVADKPSRNVLFVAVCRSFGIPARVEQATAKPQYYEQGQWKDAIFEEDKKVTSVQPKGVLILENATTNPVKPGYGTHFAIAKFADGDFRSLDLEESKDVAEFPVKLTLDTGYYRLMVGSRANDGSITVSTSYMTLQEGKTQKLAVKLPEVVGKVQVLGIVDMNTVVVIHNEKKTLKELSNDKGLVLCFTDPDKEPSKHFLQDIPARKAELEQWGGGILMMVPDDKLSKAFNPSVFQNLPKQLIWETDRQRALLQIVTGALQMEFTNNFPLTVYLSKNGGILFASAGYRIGIGDDLIKTIQLEKASVR